VATRKKAQKSAARKKKTAAKPKKKTTAKPKKKAAARAKKTARTARTKKKGAKKKTGRAPSTKKAAKGGAKKVKKAKKAKKKAIRRPRKKKPLKRVAVGDMVTVPTENRGEGEGGVGSWAARGAAEAVLGLVCSIRAIATGKLVGKTRGNLSGYLLEVIHSESFLSQGVSSVNRGGPRRFGQLRQSAAWWETRALLRELAGKQDLVSAASGRLSEEPFGALLDGWQVMKVKADAVEAPE